MDENAYKRHFIIFGYIAVICITLWAAFFLLGKYLLPFAVAWLAALFFQPLINKCVKITKIPRRIAGGIILVLMIAVSAVFAVVIINRAYSELKILVNNLGENSESIVENITGFGKGILDRFKLGDTEGAGYITETVSGAVQRGIETLTAGITAKLGDFIMKLPEMIFVTAVFIMASFYLITDFGRVNKFVASLLPERSVRVLSVIKYKIFDTAVKYFRAYMILLIMTFAELLVGFLILNVRYPLVIAAVTALLDLLPAIGVGSVLLPWAVVSFINGNAWVGAGLLILFVIMIVVRQVAETHIIGAQLGIPAIVTLLVMYIGFRSAGLIGIIAAPFIAVLIKNFFVYYLTDQKRGFTQNA